MNPTSHEPVEEYVAPPKAVPASQPPKKKHRRTPMQVITDGLDQKPKGRGYPGVSDSLRKAAFAACAEFEYYVRHVRINYGIVLDLQTVSDAFVCVCEHADLPSALTGIFSWKGEQVNFGDILVRMVDMEYRGIAILRRMRVSQSISIIMCWTRMTPNEGIIAVRNTVSPVIARHADCEFEYMTSNEFIFVKRTKTTQRITTLPVHEPFFSCTTTQRLMESPASRGWS